MLSCCRNSREASAAGEDWVRGESSQRGIQRTWRRLFGLCKEFYSEWSRKPLKDLERGDWLHFSKMPLAAMSRIDGRELSGGRGPERSHYNNVHGGWWQLNQRGGVILKVSGRLDVEFERKKGVKGFGLSWWNNVVKYWDGGNGRVCRLSGRAGSQNHGFGHAELEMMLDIQMETKQTIRWVWSWWSGLEIEIWESSAL